MRGICKSFSGVEVLRKVDFSVRKGEIMALCGENGAGKSTLMKILAGIHGYDHGEIIYRGTAARHDATPMEMQNLGVSMIHQELNLLDELTVAQNIFLCREPRSASGLINYRRMHDEAAVILERLGEKIDPRQRVRELKIAQKQMVEIAKAISFNVELLIMDEPTSMLTGKETAILFDLISVLSSRGIVVVYISHRLKEIIDICDRVTVLKDGALVVVKDVADVTAQDLATLMVGRQVQTSKAVDFAGNPDAVTLEVQDVSDDLLKGVSFKVRRGEILGFSGLVGAGRSELMIIDRPIANDQYTVFYGGDNSACGRNAAKYLGDRLKGKGQIAILRSYVGSPIDLQRYNGFMEVLKKSYPGIKVLVEGDGEFNQEAGRKAMSNILPAYPKIDAVYTQDDETAVGALTEIRSSRRTDIKFVTGVGGSKTAFALMSVRDPVYGASMSYLPAMGGRALAMAKAILQGKTFPKTNIEPTVVVTADNVAKYVDEGY